MWSSGCCPTLPVTSREERQLTHCLSAGRLEQLNRIAVRIFHQNLLAAGTDFHLIAKAHCLILEFTNACGQVLHFKDYSVPSAGFLLTTVRRGPRAGRPRTTED